ncbi:hypothetical protein HPP92_005438 [Vanilla planifolia]|uniref:Uncharacterized protein n=1 Tax=Vanilla planifolia TaxID=51239 RepID=A0A835VCM0_VANPL|nr:hypothetical protein HPP92_005438 [Vanilla planifolia]
MANSWIQLVLGCENFTYKQESRPSYDVFREVHFQLEHGSFSMESPWTPSAHGMSLSGDAQSVLWDCRMVQPIWQQISLCSLLQQVGVALFEFPS